MKNQNQTYELHLLSLVMPPMSGDDFSQLKASIEKAGQLDPIVLLDGKILDGRHRYQACCELGITPIFRDYDPATDGDSPTEFSVAKNTVRRHLTTSQRAMIAANIRPFYEQEASARKAATKLVGKGKQAETDAPAERIHTAEKAAAQLSVSPRSVKAASQVAAEAPDLAEQVTAGNITLNAAAKETKARKEASGIIPCEQQRKIAHDDLAVRWGEEFADAVLHGRLLRSAEDFTGWMDLDDDMQDAIFDLVVMRWHVKQAVRFVNDPVDVETTAADMVLKFNASGKDKASWLVNGVRITLTREA
jgi:ParB-like chromosome segregation protein Spo0J